MNDATHQAADLECPHCGGKRLHPSERDCYQVAEPAPSAELKASIEEATRLGIQAGIDLANKAWEEELPKRLEQVRAALAALGGDTVLVPREPTEAMLDAAARAPIPAVLLDSLKAREALVNGARWRAMLAAAPPAPTPGTLPDEVARRQALNDAIKACKREYLHEPQAGTEDIAYDCGVRDCINALRAIITNEREADAAIAAQATKGDGK